MDTNARNPAPAKVEELVRVLQQASGQNASREWVVCVRVHNPGTIGGTPAVLVTGATPGFDWDAGRVLLSTDKPLTTLTKAQVDAITQSARQGQSWHAYERQKALIAENESLKRRLASLLEEKTHLERALLAAKQ